MRAMILAAGLGTRLGEITQHTPKCLVRVQGKPLLAHAVDRLKAVGVNYLVINTHHLAEQVEAYVAKEMNFGIEVHLSYEPVLLDTGGGLFKVREHFLNERDFFLHNADVFHSLDLAKMLSHHRERSPVATLMMMNRQTSRYLVFDSENHLVGRTSGKDEPELVRDTAVQSLYAFSGIHVLSPGVFRYLEKFPENFSIIDGYLETVRQGGVVQAHVVEEGEWSDVGTPERLGLLNGEASV